MMFALPVKMCQPHGAPVSCLLRQFFACKKRRLSENDRNKRNRALVSVIRSNHHLGKTRMGQYIVTGGLQVERS